MLSIGKVSPGRAAYYEDSVAKGRDDYYSGSGEAPGTWVGRGSGALGLSGRVEAKRFNALVAGMDPSDPQLRRTLLSKERKSRVINGKRHDPVAAYDLTFSAPKSVSVLFATADPDTARELVRAHDRAVTAALDYLEDTAVYTRRGRNGVVVEQGDGLIAAAYRHRMSRAKDPQLHTHVVAGNVVRTPSDGQWRALHASVVYRHARTAGVLYQAHLRAEIVDRLGLHWGAVTKGAAELQGVPRPVLREFSRRRIEIEQAAAEEGSLSLSTKAGAEALALKTRTAKDQTVATADWRADIAARAEEHGFDQKTRQHLLAEGRHHPAHRASDRDHRALVNELTGPTGLTALRNTFTERDALTDLAEHHPQGLRVTDARREVARLIERDDVLTTRPAENAGVTEARHTTTDLVDCERRLVTNATGRVDLGVAVVPDRTIDAAIRHASQEPSPEQAAVVRTVARSGNGVDVVEALAGTGKTFTAGIMRDVYARHGRTVIGAAPTGRAARELSDVGIPARTLHSILLAAGHDPERAIPNGSVVILDEAGMAPTRLTEQFLQRATAAGAKVIAMGDSGQLPSVQAGGWLRQIGETTGALRLTTVMRQRDPEERRVLGLLHDRPDGGTPYLRWLDHKQRLHIDTDTPALIDRAITSWAKAADTHGLDQAVLIARDLGTRNALNDLARAHHAATGGLGEERTYDGLRIATGDRVIARRNARILDVDNGTRGIVTAVRRTGIDIRTDQGEHRTLPADYVKQHVEHAYALTGHGVQGATVEWAGVVARPEHLTKGWSYTALSRARDTTELYVPAIDHDRAQDRAELAPHDTTTHPERDETKTRIAARMTVRDDEDLAVAQLVEGQARDDDAPDHDRTADVVPYDAAPERSAARAEPPIPETADERFIRLAARLRDLQRQRDPEVSRILARLADLDTRRIVARELVERAGRQLAALTEPEHRRFRGTHDPHAADRATLTAKHAAASARLTDLNEGHRHELRALGTTPDLARSERRDLDTSIEQVGILRTEALKAVVSQVVGQEPTWAAELLRPPATRGDDIADRNARLAQIVTETLDAHPNVATEMLRPDFTLPENHALRDVAPTTEAAQQTVHLEHPEPRSEPGRF